VASAGPYANGLQACSRQITTPAPHHSIFLQAVCSSWCPVNSVKADIIILHISLSYVNNADIIVVSVTVRDDNKADIVVVRWYSSAHSCTLRSRWCYSYPYWSTLQCQWNQQGYCLLRLLLISICVRFFSVVFLVLDPQTSSQSNLTKGRITTAHGWCYLFLQLVATCTLKIAPSHGVSGPPCDTMFLGPTLVSPWRKSRSGGAQFLRANFAFSRKITIFPQILLCAQLLRKFTTLRSAIVRKFCNLRAICVKIFTFSC